MSLLRKPRGGEAVELEESVDGLGAAVARAVWCRKIPETRCATAPGCVRPDFDHVGWSGSDLDTVAADRTHRGHAIVEQVRADLKHSALAHLPSGKFTANAAWLVLAVIAFNLTRTAATLTGSDLAKATTATIRRKLISIPARVASSARRVTLHLPTAWPWETAWARLYTHGCWPPTPLTS